MTPNGRASFAALLAMASVLQPAPVRMRRSGAPAAARLSREPQVPAMPPHAECLQIVQTRGAVLRHRVTGDVRGVTVWSDGAVDFAIGNRVVRRPARKALAWLRNAESVGGAP